MKRKLCKIWLMIICICSLTACGQNVYKCPKSGYKENWKIDTTDSIVNDKNSINMKVYGNSAQQNARTLPICYNAVYDAIYYINYSDHKYIYRYKDGESKLVVEIPADYILQAPSSMVCRWFHIPHTDFPVWHGWIYR